MPAPPATDRGRRSRDRIVDAACELWYARGVGATGLADVVAASGTGKGQLYHYFADKSDLVRAVIETQAERTIAPQRELAPDTLEGLREWARIAASQHEPAPSPRCPLGSLVAELAGRDPQATDALGRGFTEWQELLGGWIAAMQRRGEVRADVPASSLAVALLAAYQGGLVLAEAHRDVAHLRTALEIAIDGFRPRPGTP